MIRPIGLKENTFVGNKAQYGADYASFPAYLETPSTDLLMNIASGQQLPYPLIFRLMDFDRQVVTNDNTS